jgi:hypothetical protein
MTDYTDEELLNMIKDRFDVGVITVLKVGEGKGRSQSYVLPFGNPYMAMGLATDAIRIITDYTRANDGNAGTF